MKNKILMVPALALLAAAAVSVDAHAAKGDMEKCAGIVKAGQNDCAANGHSCAGQSKVDNDPNSWIMVPAGTCNKITGGQVVSGMGHMDDMKGMHGKGRM